MFGREVVTNVLSSDKSMSGRLLYFLKCSYEIGPYRMGRGNKLGVYKMGLHRRVCVCVCFLPIHSGHQVRWTYQPGSHERKVTQDFSSTFFLRCVP